MGQEFPGALALQRPLRLTLLAGGPQQAATCLAKVAFECVVGPRQPRHLIAVEQAGPIAPADRVEVTAKRGEGRGDLRLALHGVERAAELPRDVRRAEGVRGHGFEDVGHVAEPGSALSEFLGGLSKGRQGRLEALIQLGAARRHSAVPAGRDSSRSRAGAARRSPYQRAERAVGL